MVCLFLCTLVAPLRAQEWTFDGATQEAYDLVLNLETDEAHARIPSPKTPQEHYVTALAEALELLLTEDTEHFNDYEKRFEQRRDRKTKASSAEDLFLQGEVALQWAFIYLKFGHEFDAALQLREAYSITQDLKKRFPKFTAIQKTSGLLDVIIGSVPEKYEWILGLLNMEGSVEQGLNELDQIQNSDHSLAFEASLLNALTQGFVLQRTDVAMTEVQKDLALQPRNRLALFLAASLAIKNAESERALKMLTNLSEQSEGLPLYYADYLRGEVYLHKAEYLNAISAYRWFINHYKGVNYIKDAHYKLGLCYWLNGNVSDAKAMFKQARTLGKESSEADKYAARSLAEEELPHAQLTRARYYTDGGYYDEARRQLEQVTPATLPTKRDQVEFNYRVARLAHKTNKIAEAKTHYDKTIQSAGDEPWYYAPNACLQLGYIAVQENQPARARELFNRALAYKKHEYKNSIDSKAKSALTQLKKQQRADSR